MAMMNAVGVVEESIIAMRLDQAIGELAAVMRAANRYFDAAQPWVLAKNGNTERLRTVLYVSCETLRITAGLLFPVMPSKMKELMLMLGIDCESPDISGLRSWGGLKPGSTTGKKEMLFPRITFKAAAPETAPENSNKEKRIEYDDFAKVKLRAAKVLSAEPVEGADKLLKLRIDVGTEERTLVAGLASSYKPEELVGKTVVVVANLKPAKIRGVESNGMLLAACRGDETKVVTIDGDMPPGATVR